MLKRNSLCIFRNCKKWNRLFKRTIYDGGNLKTFDVLNKRGLAKPLIDEAQSMYLYLRARNEIKCEFALSPESCNDEDIIIKDMHGLRLVQVVEGSFDEQKALSNFELSQKGMVYTGQFRERKGREVVAYGSGSVFDADDQNDRAIYKAIDRIKEKLKKNYSRSKYLLVNFRYPFYISFYDYGKVERAFKNEVFVSENSLEVMMVLYCDGVEMKTFDISLESCVS